MAAPLIFLTIGGLLGVAFLLGAGDAKAATVEPKANKVYKPESSAGKAALAKAKAKDWQAAVSEAIAAYKATGDRQAVLAVMKELKAAGKSSEYLALGAVLTADDPKVQAARANAPKLAKPKDKPAPAPAKPKPPVAAKPKPPVAAKPKPAPAPTPAPAPVEPSPEQKQAAELAAMLKASAKYSEDREKVKAYQAANYLVADGLYGPDTAKTLWSIWSVIPPNPFYWPKGKEAAEKAAYSSFLDSIAVRAPEAGPTVGRLKGEL